MRWLADATCLLLIVGSPAIGSFLGTVGDRWQRGEPVGFCRSKCAACSVVLPPRDLIPLLSYWILGGRCRFCRADIPQKLVAIEAVAFTVTLATMAVAAPSLRVTATLFAWIMLALLWLDYEQGRLPDALTIPLGAAGLGVAAVTGTAVVDHFLGAAVGLALPAGVALAFKSWRGRDGLGGGDIKMLAAIGAWVGWQGLSVVLLLASVSALAVCLTYGRATPGASVRFGPFIAAAAWIVCLLRPFEGAI